MKRSKLKEKWLHHAWTFTNWSQQSYAEIKKILSIINYIFAGVFIKFFITHRYTCIPYHDKKSFPLGVNILGTTMCNHQTASRWIVDTDFWNSSSTDASTIN